MLGHSAWPHSQQVVEAGCAEGLAAFEVPHTCCVWLSWGFTMVTFAYQYFIYGGIIIHQTFSFYLLNSFMYSFIH